jgi:hypothetical protein
VLVRPTLPEAVTLRFIIPNAKSKRAPKLSATEAKGEANDVLRFDIGASKKVLEKYFVANAFLRYAVGQPFEFVGRSEDDALVNMSLLVQQHLQRLLPSAPSETGMVLYGVKGAWVMWDFLSMLPVCWNAKVSQVGVGGCGRSSGGPVLLLQGPLVIYSQRVAQALLRVPRFETDEARVRTNWSGICAERTARELALNPGQPPRLGLVHSGLAEDVYYSWLLTSALNRHNLTIVSVPMSEYAWYKARPSSKLRGAAVYHRALSSFHHLNVSGLIARSTKRLAPADASPTSLLSSWWLKKPLSPLARCRGFGTKFSKLYQQAKTTRARDRYCCSQWRLCEP